MSDKAHYYTARVFDSESVGIRLPGNEYILTRAEARKLRDSITAALLPPPKPQKKCPMWLLTLRGMAHAGKPLFWGLLEEENGVPRWTKDEELADFMAKEWVVIVEGGFVITEQGKKAYEQEWPKCEKR